MTYISWSSDFALYYSVAEHHWIMGQYDLTSDLKVFVGHSDLYISWSTEFALYLED